MESDRVRNTVPPMVWRERHIQEHLRVVEAELAHLGNLRALADEAPEIGAACTRRCELCWERIARELGEARERALGALEEASRRS